MIRRPPRSTRTDTLFPYTTLFRSAGLPVPRGIVVRSADEAAAFAERVGFPLVPKPLDGNHGRGVSTAVLNEAQFREGFELAIKHSGRVVVERHFSGNDHRLSLVGGKVVAGAQRVPAKGGSEGRRGGSGCVRKFNS